MSTLHAAASSARAAQREIALVSSSLSQVQQACDRYSSGLQHAGFGRAAQTLTSLAEQTKNLLVNLDASEVMASSTSAALLATDLDNLDIAQQALKKVRLQLADLRASIKATTKEVNDIGGALAKLGSRTDHVLEKCQQVMQSLTKATAHVEAATYAVDQASSATGKGAQTPATPEPNADTQTSDQDLINRFKRGPGRTQGPRFASPQPIEVNPTSSSGRIPPNEIPPPLHRTKPLPTKSVNQDYVGENDPNCPNRPFITTVTYLTPKKRERHRLFIKDQKLYWAIDGTPFDTRTAQTAGYRQGRAIFVMDCHGNLYASNEHFVGKFHHSSFLAGEPISGAGEMEAVDGELVMISRRSGHYHPTPEQHEKVKEILVELGISLDTVRIKDGF